MVGGVARTRQQPGDGGGDDADDTVRCGGPLRGGHLGRQASTTDGTGCSGGDDARTHCRATAANAVVVE